ncbi:hypothetical protein TBLA_0I01090 [Henningerozyma blattae CBS 6284]|uniref:Aquaporin n=1 Tax=Henningerozyma blattae (strain ATCC 34711 / CBS 6284 / DSM 70876 / NBRC 10599 / NRRL Y-10934 / UCD 77-7) TaxID=1071380 RepID=I2H8R6_HENB6|nr:hypothetical protein TBLA_0I01090 [Tetrapisispora blattae CBS 6284]CCH62768.1 hypothetical protein TBLA_0I01090 [Tetrapisispora blattae CBS 6284]
MNTNDLENDITPTNSDSGTGGNKNEGNKTKLKTRFSVGPDSLRNHFIACYGEFVGTFIFLFCAYTIANIANHDWQLESYPGRTTSHPSQLIMIALGFGFSLMFAVWCFAGVSGAALNPAVSLTLVLSRAITPTRCLVHWIAQIIAGMAAGGAVSAITPGEVLYANTLGLGMSRTRGLFLEMFGTSFLCLTVMMTAIEPTGSNAVCAIPIGVVLFIIHLSLVAYTGCGVNPARSLGAALAKKSFPPYHWIYWIGPLLGGLLGWSVWQLLVWLDYQLYVEAEKSGKSVEELRREKED